MTLFYKLKRIRWTSRIFVITPIISLCLLFTHEKPLAANFNVKKLTLSDLETLEKRRVPRDFPHYATNLTQSCETSEGKKWRDSVRAGWTNDFFWGSHIWRRGARLFEGQRQNRNVFSIRVSYASKTSRASRNKLTYRIKGRDLTEELVKGVTAEYRNGRGYWRRCTLKAGSNIREYDAISVDASRSALNKLERHVRELNVLAVQQERAVVDITKYGLKIDYLFDFDGLLPKLESQLAVLREERKEQIVVKRELPSNEPLQAEVNPFQRKQDLWNGWSDAELCEVSANALASANLLREIENRGIDCGSSGQILANSISSESDEESEELKLANAERARQLAQEEKRVKEAEEIARKLAEEEKRIAELENARKKAEDDRRIAEVENARKRANEEKAKILADRETPKIQVIAVNSKGALGTVEGLITDDVAVDVVMIDGQIVELSSDGSFTHEIYIPRNGKVLEIIAFDESGKRAAQNLTLDRSTVSAPRGPQFASLNPAARPAKINGNAAALIIGIAEYERTPAPAAFADKDAQYFYDYASLKLGVPEENILELINEKADRIEFKLAVRNWLTSIADANTDLYVFFAGHGMGSDDGKSMFLLPYDGTPALLEDSAIRRDQLFKDIASLNPNSVTVFLDTCYSGSTRESEMLIAARPVLIKVNEQEIPDGFAVFTAASGEQTAKPLPQVEQGLFSYFLMRGLEGEADANQNGKVTAGELHEYTRKNVNRFSSGTQTPEFQGDDERVLVTFQ